MRPTVLRACNGAVATYIRLGLEIVRVTEPSVMLASSPIIFVTDCALLYMTKYGELVPPPDPHIPLCHHFCDKLVFGLAKRAG